MKQQQVIEILSRVKFTTNIRITDINFLLVFIIVIFSVSCSSSLKRNRLDSEKFYKPYFIVSLDKSVKYNDTLISSSSKWSNIYRKKIDSFEYYFYKKRKIFEVNPNKTSVLIEEFDKKFILLSQCKRDNMVAGPFALQRYYLVILNTEDDKLYDVVFKNAFSLQREEIIRHYNSNSSSINPTFGLVSIDIDNLKLRLLEMTQKEIELEIHPR